MKCRHGNWTNDETGIALMLNLYVGRPGGYKEDEK